jgi:cysteine desulfurase
MQQVYLDHSATTPLDQRVLNKMLPYFSDDFGNTSSAHSIGRKAESAVENARETIANLLNCKPSEIIFTSGGTESDNLAIRGVGWSSAGKHLITTPVEHSAVTNTIKQMVDLMGFEQTIIPVDQYASVEPTAYADLITEQTSLTSVIYANNEVGTIAPLAQIAEQAHRRNVLLHTDAVQAAGQLSLDVQELGVDLMSISAHKFYGPKGVGALYCRDGVKLSPSQTGGSHESGQRAGTLNTPGIIGMAEAMRLAYAEHEERLKHYEYIRNCLIDGVTNNIDDVFLTGHPTERLPSHASFVFSDIDSTKLLMHLDMKGIASSAASACKTGNPEPSSVLLAMGYEPELTISSLRLTVGKDTTEADIDYAVGALAQSVETLRKLKRVTL